MTMNVNVSLSAFLLTYVLVNYYSARSRFCRALVLLQYERKDALVATTAPSCQTTLVASLLCPKERKNTLNHKRYYLNRTRVE